MRTIRPRLGGGSVWVALAVALMACGGGTSSQGRDPTPDATDAVALDGQAESTGNDAVADAETGSVDVQVPTACLTGQVCAADTDCNQGERCNLTLVPPECQILYCAKEAEACDPSQGDALCAPGLVCTGAPEPACCAPDCEGKACGSDGCGGSCGACGCGEECTAGACLLTACDGRECGDDGCGGSCGTCPGLQDACLDGGCVCQPDCTGKECGEDGCGAVCGACQSPLDACVAGQCVCQPSCQGRTCGDDGCGGSCGGCASGNGCDDGTCASTWYEETGGLTWQLGFGGTMSWPVAKEYCSSNQAGLPGTGWRLPNVDELRGRIFGCPENQAGGSCVVHAECAGSSCEKNCPGCAENDGPGMEGCYLNGPFEQPCKLIWSSTPYSASSTSGYYVNFANGGVYGNAGGGVVGVLCVRTGQ